MKQNLMSAVKCTALAALFASTFGCMKASVAIQPIQGSINTDQADVTTKAHFLLWGLAGDGTIDTSRLCPNGGAHWMQSQATVVDSILSMVTGGIYAPRTIYVKCASGTAYRLEPNADQGVTMAFPAEDEEMLELEAMQ
jgi:hypothetical protein